VRASGGRFAAAYAFEPDPALAGRLAAAVAGLPRGLRDRVVVRRAAVAAASGALRFTGDGTPGSRVATAGELTIDAVRLDDVVADGPAPTFIKMDVEGAEVDALLGARTTIARVRPILAVCVYHLQDDLQRIINLLGTTCRDYGLHLRRLEGDLVCFAVPRERSLDSGGV
jgi:FkbM family methyltransferase